MAKSKITIDELSLLATAIANLATIGSEEAGLVLMSYSKTQNETNLFPTNAVDDSRLWKLATRMWYFGRAYERIYSCKSSAKKEE